MRREQFKVAATRKSIAGFAPGGESWRQFGGVLALALALGAALGEGARAGLAVPALGRAHAVSDGGEPAAHVVDVVRLDHVLHVVVGFENERVLVIGHLEGGRLPRFHDQEAEDAAAGFRCLRGRVELEHVP